MPNDPDHSLARIPLRWMIRECFKAKTGIIFDAHMLKYETGLSIGSGPAFEAPPPVSPTSETPPGGGSAGPTGDESLEEIRDTRSHIYDKLKELAYWKIVELIPSMFPSSLELSAPITSLYGA